MSLISIFFVKTWSKHELVIESPSEIINTWDESIKRWYSEAITELLLMLISPKIIEPNDKWNNITQDVSKKLYYLRPTRVKWNLSGDLEHMTFLYWIW